jgi:hypothetical protein
VRPRAAVVVGGFKPESGCRTGDGGVGVGRSGHAVAVVRRTMVDRRRPAAADRRRQRERRVPEALFAAHRKTQEPSRWKAREVENSVRWRRSGPRRVLFSVAAAASSCPVLDGAAETILTTWLILF